MFHPGRTVFETEDDFSVSVVIPLYDKRAHIRRCLDTALTALDKFEVDRRPRRPDENGPEIIVMDDGSRDGGPDIVALEYLSDPRVKLLRQKNAGASAARNAASRAASGDYIAFLDADDEWTADHVVELSEMASRFPEADMLATSYAQILPDGSRRDPDFAHVPKDGPGVIERYFRSMAHGAMPVSSSTAAVRRDAMLRIGGFPENETHGEDRVFWARMAEQGQVAWSPRQTSLYHLDAENRSDQSWTPKKAGAYMKHLEGMMSRTTPGSQLARDVRENLSSEVFYLARNCVMRGHGLAATKLLADLRKTGSAAASACLEHCIRNPDQASKVMFPQNGTTDLSLPSRMSVSRGDHAR